MSSASSVKTIDRLVSVLDSFTASRPAWSLVELSAHLGLPKSTLHRFLTSLESHGILRRDPDDKLWRLGYRLFIWGSSAAESTGLREIANPVLRDLVAATGETAILTVYHKQEVICLDKVETRHSVRLTLEVGRRRPPHAGASSKVLMAFLPEDEIRAIVQEKGLPRLCTNTITDPDELDVEFTKIRDQGFAESCEETDHSAWGVATPIYDRNRQVIAAVGIAGPSSRFTREFARQCVTLCLQAAQRISILLGMAAESHSDAPTLT